jgi:nucleoid-associated protein YgaU
MQKIERYGVMALVLLLLTIVTVSFWGEGSAVAAQSQKIQTASGDAPARPTARDADRKLPATSIPSAKARGRNYRNGEQRRNQNQKKTAGRIETLPFPEALAGKGSRPAASNTGRARGQTLAVGRKNPSQAMGLAALGHQGQGRKMQLTSTQARLGVTSPSKAASSPRVHIVQAGDTLGEIAYAALGTSKRWREIADLNGGSERIFLGQRLKLPAGGTDIATNNSNASGQKAAPSVAQTSKAAPTVGSHTYVVRPGDMLSVIAQRELGSARRWRDIVALNPGLDPDSLSVGARLVMPRGKSSGRNLLAQARTSATKVGRVR